MNRRAAALAVAVALVIAVSVPALAAARRAPGGRVAAPPLQAQGIDVSDHQDQMGRIKWHDVATQYEFAFVKATEGVSYTNRYYPGDLASALSAGLYAGGYAFATPDAASGAAEATYFLRRSAYALGGKVLFPMVDLEWDPYDAGDGCWGLSQAALVAWLGDYTTTITAALGVEPIIYTQASFWNDCTGGSSAFDRYPLWVQSEGATVTLPAGFTTWALWQWSIDGSASGVTGPVDADTFAGTTKQLASRFTDPDASRCSQGVQLHLCY